MNAELWPRNRPFPVLNTPMLCAALPYRSINPGLIYYNLKSIGFGLLFNPKKLQELMRIRTLLAQPMLDYAFMLYHHHTEYQWLLFISTQLPSYGLLCETRQQLESCLKGMTTPYQRLCRNNFLVLLRSMLSPNLNDKSWPGLVDIQHKSFHTIIPNPGTQYTLAPDYLDIRTLDAYATWQSSRITLLHSAIGLDGLESLFQCSLLPWQAPPPLQNWMMRFDSSGHDLMLISTPQQAHHPINHVCKTYAQLKLPVKISATPWISFLNSLPFANNIGLRHVLK